MKTIFVLCVAVSLANQFMLPTADALGLQDNIPFDDLSDQKLKGLFIGGGVGYGITNVIPSGDDAEAVDPEEEGQFGQGFVGQMKWRIGYATTERFGLYITSTFDEFRPELGFISFNSSDSGYYIHALAGYSNSIAKVGGFEFISEEGTARVDLSAGFGYRFRPHFTTEFSLAYSRSAPDLVHSAFGAGTSLRADDLIINQVSVVFSLNCLLY